MAAMCISLERALLAEKYGNIVAESMKIPSISAVPYLNTYGTAT
jgi:hypothetical protein